MIRPLNIDTLRSSTRAAVTRDQPILRIDPSAGYEYAPAPAFPSNVPSAARTSASPSVPARAGAAKTSRIAASPSPRRSIEVPMLLRGAAWGECG